MTDRFSDEPAPTEAEIAQEEINSFFDEYLSAGRRKSVLIAWLKSSPHLAAHLTEIIVEHLEEPRKEHLGDRISRQTQELYSDIYDMYAYGVIDAFSKFPADERQRKEYPNKSWEQLGSKQKLFEVARHFDKSIGHIKKIVSEEKKRRGD